MGDDLNVTTNIEEEVKDADEANDEKDEHVSVRPQAFQSKTVLRKTTSFLIFILAVLNRILCFLLM